MWGAALVQRRYSPRVSVIVLSAILVLLAVLVVGASSAGVRLSVLGMPAPIVGLLQFAAVAGCPAGTWIAMTLFARALLHSGRRRPDPPAWRVEHVRSSCELQAVPLAPRAYWAWIAACIGTTGAAVAALLWWGGAWLLRAGPMVTALVIGVGAWLPFALGKVLLHRVQRRRVTVRWLPASLQVSTDERVWSFPLRHIESLNWHRTGALARLEVRLNGPARAQRLCVWVGDGARAQEQTALPPLLQRHVRALSAAGLKAVGELSATRCTRFRRITSQ